MGLAFDEWDLDYYTNMFKNEMKRDPTNVELFDIAQSNSGGCSHGCTCPAPILVLACISSIGMHNVCALDILGALHLPACAWMMPAHPRPPPPALAALQSTLAIGSSVETW